MKHQFPFTFQFIENQYQQLKDLGYDFITCAEYVEIKKHTYGKVIVNRVDIDFSVKKTAELLDIFNRLGIKATFFIRLHAPEYNPFSFENYLILKRIIDEGHEMGYHSEVVDQAAIWGEDAAVCLKRDIDILNRMFNTKIVGVASHGGMTGLNNLDFWKERKAPDYGLLYEAYDKQPEFNLFQEAFYVSDSEWTRWKAYDKGVLCTDDRRTPVEHAQDGHKLLHLLIHPDTYYKNHIYE
jgi:peptidoglycan/xylan/chitin deacetylase (PgdA/CDA1 family)